MELSACNDQGVTVELKPEALRRFGRTLVVAPHPDDEALGCGGLVALLRRADQQVCAVLVTDGGQSHPASLQFDRPARRDVRQREWQQGLACLGVLSGCLTCLGWPDGDLPQRGDAPVAAAVQELRRLLMRVAPQTIVLPWRRDPHPDHRATNALFRAAMAPLHQGVRCLEYAVWLGERGTCHDRPRAREVRSWRLGIADVLDAKRAAIACHRSQQGGVFIDDPDGFRLPAALLARAALPFELFFEDMAPA